jgi:putative membrane protein
MAKNAAIIFMWIIHLSALVGIYLGYEDFFLPKSPFTLVYLFLVTILFIPVANKKTALLFAAFFATGFIVEWIGVHTGVLFGDYFYGKNMGIKIDKIPLLIGANWAVLTLSSHIIASKLFTSIWIKAFAGASLMVVLDFALEQICDYAGFWHFSGGIAGWYNYVCWFVVAYALHVLAGIYKVKGNFTAAIHIYTVQLLFTIALWIIITT